MWVFLFLFIFLNKFIYLCYLFLAALGLRCCMQASSAPSVPPCLLQVLDTASPPLDLQIGGTCLGFQLDSCTRDPQTESAGLWRPCVFLTQFCENPSSFLWSRRPRQWGGENEVWRWGLKRIVTSLSYSSFASSDPEHSLCDRQDRLICI